MTDDLARQLASANATIDGLNDCLANERTARKMAEESYAKAYAFMQSDLSETQAALDELIAQPWSPDVCMKAIALREKQRRNECSPSSEKQ